MQASSVQLEGLCHPLCLLSPVHQPAGCWDTASARSLQVDVLLHPPLSTRSPVSVELQGGKVLREQLDVPVYSPVRAQQRHA